MHLLKPTLPGYEHIPRRWEGKLNTVVATVFPGEYYVTEEDEAVTTTLGSCISCCIRDKYLGIGGLNHFMIPQKDIPFNQGDTESFGKEGYWAMEFLINGILLNGGERKNLEVKIFGGAQMLTGLSHMAIGQNNIEFVQAYIKRENLALKASDIGGPQPRKVIYYPKTGKVKLRKLSSANNQKIQTAEATYAGKTVCHDSHAGEVSLF